MFERIINLIDNSNFQKIENSKILLVGIGGVGGFVLEGLVRSGFQKITIIDGDIIEKSNINRQLVANLTTLNQPKVTIAKKNMQLINKSCQINALNTFLDEYNINSLETDFDYIIDACDTLKTKLALIKFANEKNIKIISSMGVGNRLDASKITLTKLSQTKNDPLAKRLRKLLRDNDLKLSIPVVWSTELPIKKEQVNSLITTPGIAGLLIVNYIINDLIFSN